MELTREDFRDIFWRGVGGLENLHGSEHAAFLAWHGACLRMFEAFYFQRVDGSFDGRLFDSWVTQLQDLFANPGSREYWALRKHQFSAEFVTFMDQAIENATPNSMCQENA